MHSKDFWGVHKWEAIDVVQVLLYGLKDRDAIPLVVAEGWLEHPLIEPVLYVENVCFLSLLLPPALPYGCQPLHDLCAV